MPVPRTFKVQVLFVLVGVSAWIAIQSLFSELSVMLKQLPEGPSVASQLVLAIQCGNLGPMVYSLLRPRLRTGMIFVLFSGLAALVFVALTWNRTVNVAGYERSLFLILGTFLSAVADCTSNLVFWPYASSFGAPYVTALALGESCSSAVTALVFFLQKTLIFCSPTSFFMIIAAIVSVCVCAFFLLEFHYGAKMVEKGEEAVVGGTNVSAAYPDVPDASAREILRAEWKLLLVIVWMSMVQNGFTPSILPLVAGPAYGTAQNVLFFMAPFSSLLAAWLRPKRSLHLSLFMFTTATLVPKLLIS
jgi:hypothetical protein